MPPPPILIGTSGWNFDTWKNDFYAGVPRREWLAHCARQFTALEINGTFYRRPNAETLNRWLQATPPGFPLAAKGHRFLTHYLGLAGAAQSLALQKDYLSPLAPRLSAMLWQLPSRRSKDLALLEGFLNDLALWPETRHVIEFRHASWFTEEVAGHLAAHRVASCISDATAWPCWDAVTTDVAYVRLHGHEQTYASRYDDAALGRWAERIRQWRSEGRTVHVYFDNDQNGWAPKDAVRLRTILEA